jgi:2-polyprenyl-6-methoxyphenol hydroxylase-like FAD-dependent oxidoreductase
MTAEPVSAETDCAVVGGGPAGALLALLPARVIGLGFKRVHVEQ